MQKDQNWAHKYNSELKVTIDCDDGEVFVTKWIYINDFMLSEADKDIIFNGDFLSYKHINASQNY